MAKPELKEIPINQISVRENYRKTFNDKSLAELAQSIKENGVIEPIIVRPGKGGFVIIAGERRFRASQIAGLVTMPCVVREADDMDTLRLQIIENVQREGVPFMEEAYGIQKLRDKGSLDVKEIAKLIGKSTNYVYFQLRLTAMSPDARNIAEKGWIAKSVAWQIANLPNEDDQTKAANDLARTQKDKLITASGAKNYIADTFGDSDGALRKRRVSKFGLGSHEDFAANWKHHLVRFTSEQFEAFKKIVRGRTENTVLSEAVDAVMRESGSKADTTVTNGKKPAPKREMEFVNA